MCNFLRKIITIVLCAALFVTSIPVNGYALRPVAYKPSVHAADPNPPKAVKRYSDSMFRVSSSAHKPKMMMLPVENTSDDDSDEESSPGEILFFFIVNSILFITGAYSWLAHKFFPGYDGFWKASFVGFLLASLGFGLFKQLIKFLSDYITNESEDHYLEPKEVAAAVIVSLILLPIVLYFNWGLILPNIWYGIKLFFTVVLPIKLGWVFVVKAFSKLIGRESYKDEDDVGFGLFIIAAVFCAPIIEEVLFRAILFNLEVLVWFKWFNLEALLWGIPFGILLSMVGNADDFWKAHGKDKGVSQWLGGIFLGYAYWKSGSLIAPMTLHFLWNLSVIVIFYFIPRFFSAESLSILTKGRPRFGSNRANASLSKGDLGKAQILTTEDGSEEIALEKQPDYIAESLGNKGSAAGTTDIAILPDLPSNTSLIEVNSGKLRRDVLVLINAAA